MFISQPIQEGKNRSNTNVEKARELCTKVKDICNEYGMDFFFVTEGASVTHCTGNSAVRHARECQKEWERNNGFDPGEDWGKK